MLYFICRFYGLLVKIIARIKKTPYSGKNIILTNIFKNHQKYLYKYNRDDYKKYMQEYSPDCDLLNFSVVNKNKYFGNETYFIDENGVPLLLRNNEYVMNIVVFCQYALLKYGNYIRNNSLNDKIEFLHLADILCNMQGKKGEYLYYYDFPYYLNKDAFKKTGWTGAMQHGQALSVLYRAHLISNNNKFIQCGDKIIEYLSTPLQEGGVKGNLSDIGYDKNKLFFEEWPVYPESYTLNGYIFVLLGVYDWSFSIGKNAKKAKQLFDEGISSLKLIIHLYDLNGGSSYDLGHITYKRVCPHYMGDYHAIHIAQLYILYKITGENEFYNYYVKWKSLISNE